MAKPSPERLLPSTYPWSFDMPPRFGDIDPLRHLNNAALARFYEDGRVRFVDSIGARAAVEPGYGFVVAEVAIQYLAEGRYPDVVTVSTGLLRLGRSSFTMAQALFQCGACIGAAEPTLVHVHRQERGARPLPDGLRTALLAYALAPPAAEALQLHSTAETFREVHHA